MSEPTVNINGTSLTEAQAMTLRVAVTDFLTRMSNVGDLGEDQAGEDIRQRYSERSTEIVSLMLSPAAPSLAIETEEMDRAWRTWIETSSCRTAVGHFAFAAGYAAAKDATPPPQTHVALRPHEPTPEMLAAAMRADQDGMPASMKTIWMVMWGAYSHGALATMEGSADA